MSRKKKQPTAQEFVEWITRMPDKDDKKTTQILYQTESTTNDNTRWYPNPYTPDPGKGGYPWQPWYPQPTPTKHETITYSYQYHCPLCDRFISSTEMYKYCPHCGAKIVFDGDLAKIRQIMETLETLLHNYLKKKMEEDINTS